MSRNKSTLGTHFPSAEMAGWLTSYTDAPRYHEVILLGLHGCRQEQIGGSGVGCRWMNIAYHGVNRSSRFSPAMVLAWAGACETGLEL